MTGWIRACTGTVFASISAEYESEDGTPVRRFRKEIMRTGTYVKKDQRFTITHDSLYNWVAQFARMKENGVKVPMPATHEAEGDPDKNRGWIREMYVEGDSLFANCELIGRDGIDSAKKADVSIKSPPAYRDGQGVEYTRPITHVALCTDPVVTGLSAFIPLAASLGGGEDSPMKELKKTLKALKIKASDTAEVTDEQLDELLCSAVTKMADDHKTIVASEKKFKSSTATLEASLAEYKDIQLPKKKDVDPVMVELLRDNRMLKLGNCVKCSRLTKAEHDIIAEKRLSKEALTLELQTTKSASDADFDFWMGVISRNDPVKIGEETGGQTLSLANPVNAGDGDEGALSKMMTSDAKAEHDLAASMQ